MLQNYNLFIHPRQWPNRSMAMIIQPMTYRIPTPAPDSAIWSLSSPLSLYV